MGENNILSGGVDILTQVREALTALDTTRARIAELEFNETKLKKDIASKEKIQTEEIETTIKKREAEVSESFDGQMDSTRTRLKKVKASRDKAKAAGVSERIGRETADIVEEKRKLRQDLKAVFKVNQIPQIFNTGLFFSLFLPGEALDILKIAIGIIILVLIPMGVNLVLPIYARSTLLTIVMYLGLFVLVFAIYFLVFKFVRTKHLDHLKEARAIRAKIKRSEKQADRMGKAIKQDTDESGYNLDQYDAEIAELEAKVVEISESKKDALTVFENQTKPDITAEIKGRHAAELDSLRAAYDQTYAEKKQLEDQVNAAILDISGKYEGYIGKENLQISTIDALIEIINTGDAINIADAMVVYKNRITAAKEAK